MPQLSGLGVRSIVIVNVFQLSGRESQDHRFSSSLDLSLPPTKVHSLPSPLVLHGLLSLALRICPLLTSLDCHHPFSSLSCLRISVPHPPGEPLLLKLLLLLLLPSPATFASFTARCHLNCPVFMLPAQHAILILKIKEIDFFFFERSLLVVLRMQQQGQYKKGASQLT